MTSTGLPGYIIPLSNSDEHLFPLLNIPVHNASTPVS